MPVGSSSYTSAREWWTWQVQATAKALPIFCPSITTGIVKAAIVKRMNTSWAMLDGERSSSPRRVSEPTTSCVSALQNGNCSNTHNHSDFHGHYVLQMSLKARIFAVYLHIKQFISYWTIRYENVSVCLRSVLIQNRVLCLFLSKTGNAVRTLKRQVA